MSDLCSHVRWLMLSFTRKLPWFLFLWLAGFFTLQAAGGSKATFYVQLIRGSDTDKPDDPAWKPAGAKLGKNLHGVFRWKHYWEVKRETVTLSKNETARLHLTRDREVEIRLLDPPNTRIRLYHNGQLIRCSHQPIREHMSILGGESNVGECWFVVVRADKPTDSD